MKKYPGVKVGPTIPATISKVGVHPNPRKDTASVAEHNVGVWHVITVPPPRKKS